MVKDAFYFIIPLLGLAVAGIVFELLWLSLVCVALAAFVAFFFRNPDRTIPEDPRAIVSPADGKVIRLEKTPEGTKIVIFLSVFNVHVNRAPIAGRIESLTHQSGKFRFAWDDRASVDNEQVVFKVRGDREITFSLIAGLVARRIVPWKKLGDLVSKGERIALIRFGSRVDIWIPEDAEVRVANGDTVKGGTSVLAAWSD